MTTPSLLDDLAAYPPQEPATALHNSRGHLWVEPAEEHRTGLYLVDLGRVVNVWGSIDLTADQARAVAAHLTAWAERKEIA